MATILEQHLVGDGYDVRILTAGQAHVLHFVAQPSAGDLADAIDAFERRLIEQTVSDHKLEEVT